ncbi:MAG: YceI family protein [Bacteroidia bacterium]|nr:YceI family protein [Bacteroidia bacterium]
MTWALDPTHSEVGFKVKHLMITNVSGSFSKFNAEVSSDDETFAKAAIVFSADIDSISTNNEQRDGHLKSPDFFDAANHPQLIIKADGLTGEGENRKMNGTLTMRGVTHPVAFNVDFGGVAKDPWGNTKAGFTLTGTINRKDFGLNWNAPTEAGGLLVSEDVRLHAEIQLVKQA